MANLKHTMRTTVQYLERLLLERDRSHALDLVFTPALNGGKPGWLLLADDNLCCSGTLVEARELTADGSEAFLYTCWDAVIAKERAGLLPCLSTSELAQRRAREHAALVASGTPAAISKRVLEIGYPAWLMRGAVSPFRHAKRPVDAWELAEKLELDVARSALKSDRLFLIQWSEMWPGVKMCRNTPIQTRFSVEMLQAELNDEARERWAHDPQAPAGYKLSHLTWPGADRLTIFVNGERAIVLSYRFASRCLSYSPYLLRDVLKACLQRFGAEGFSKEAFEAWGSDTTAQAKWPDSPALRPTVEPKSIRLKSDNRFAGVPCAEYPGDPQPAAFIQMVMEREAAVRKAGIHD